MTKEELKSPERKGVKKDTAVLKERATSEPPREGKKNIQQYPITKSSIRRFIQ